MEGLWVLGGLKWEHGKLSPSRITEDGSFLLVILCFSELTQVHFCMCRMHRCLRCGASMENGRGSSYRRRMAVARSCLVTASSCAHTLASMLKLRAMQLLAAGLNKEIG